MESTLTDREAVEISVVKLKYGVKGTISRLSIKQEEDGDIDTSCFSWPLVLVLLLDHNGNGGAFGGGGCDNHEVVNVYIDAKAWTDFRIKYSSC